MSEIIIKQLSKSFASQAVLQDVTLHIQHGEFVAVLGPSGCGKTTLLRTLAGFETIDSGSISVGDRLYSSANTHLPPEKRQLGIVFQSYALWPHMSVAENIAYSLKVSGVATNERRQRTQSALELVGLEGFAERNPADLSGGQRQRVALARCLVARPQVVLLDEPLANLDVHLRAAMEEEFARFHHHSGATLLYITHDQQEAMAIADRVVVMDAGRVMQFASPRTLYREPACEMVARFIDDGRVIDVTDIEPDHNGYAWVTLLGVRLRLRARAEQPVAPRGKVCLHAADLRLAHEDEAGFAVRIQRLIYRGGYSQLDVEPEDDSCRLTLHLTDAQQLRCGDRLMLTADDGWVIPTAS
ncbi:ABC transporter ATP-binding protein [Pantoea sp. B65]|uniref:ABC transporter ATP-binding protein n=1 Tax=Pantoea sp. B65 TaxID=2813359 RepID=UPI0039B46B9C